jgi:hypothetical protein
MCGLDPTRDSRHGDASPIALQAPFFAVGLVGGWLVAEIHHLDRSGTELALRGLLTIITPLVCVFLGARVHPRQADSALGAVLALTVSASIAGVANGAIIGFFAMPPHGALLASPWGFVCALPFVPVLAVIVLAARRVGRARAGSVVDRSDRRGVWVATMAAIALATVAVAPHGESLRGVPFWIALSCTEVALALTILDLVERRRVGRPVVLSGPLRPRAPASQETPDDEAGVAAHVEVYDAGLGEATFEELAPAPQPYRSTERVLRIHRGSRALAREALAAAAWRGLAAVIATGTAVAAHLLLA